jgi:ABC-type amino acid transport substrate-binding protein
MTQDPSMHPLSETARLKRRSLLLAAPLALALPWSAQATELKDLDKINASGALKVAVYKDNAPYSDGQGQAFGGLDVALAQGLARELACN